jgi:hypothetical protein
LTIPFVAYAAPDLKSEMRLQISRYQNGASAAALGAPSANKLIADSSAKFSALLDAAAHGGQLGTCTIARPAQATQEKLERLGQAWAVFQRAGSAIVQNQAGMQSVANAVETINQTEPDVLESALVVASLSSTRDTAPQNIHAASMLAFRLERFVKSANRLLLEPTANPIEAFLVQKESQTLSTSITDLVEGSASSKIVKSKSDVQSQLHVLAKKIQRDMDAAALINSNLQALALTKQSIAYVNDHGEELYSKIQELGEDLAQASTCR